MSILKFIARFTNVTNYADCTKPPQRYFPTSGALVFIFNKFIACLGCMIPLFLAMCAQGRILLALSFFLEAGGFPFEILDFVGQFFDNGD